MFDLIEGLEYVEAVKFDERGTIYILYTITDEFMDQNELTHKHRVFEIDLYQLCGEPTFVSYGVEDEPDED